MVRKKFPFTVQPKLIFYWQYWVVGLMDSITFFPLRRLLISETDWFFDFWVNKRRTASFVIVRR